MRKNALVLFIGNPIYSDDRIGILVGEVLKDRLILEGIDVKIVEGMGYTLMDIIADRETVVFVDSIKSDKFEIGEVVLVNVDDSSIYTPHSPHYSGLPELLQIMKSLDLGLPKKIYVIGIVVKDPYTISENLTPDLLSKLNKIIERVYKLIKKLI